MACRNAYKTITTEAIETAQPEASTPVKSAKRERLLFCVDSKVQANDLLQNNIDLFEWVKRNKIYPCLWGRNINGENSLTKEEIQFLHKKGCMIALIYKPHGEMKTDTQGKDIANKISMRALELDIFGGTTIFLEIGENENASRDFMRGFAKTLIELGYIPAFKANTDAKCSFDREFSRGMQTDKDVFSKCIIWATAPTVPEYNGITTSHLIHPDNWHPYAPSCMTRRDIAIWQYGVDCHPIEDDMEKVITFNVDLVRNEEIIKNMF